MDGPSSRVRDRGSIPLRGPQARAVKVKFRTFSATPHEEEDAAFPGLIKTPLKREELIVVDAPDDAELVQETKDWFVTARQDLGAEVHEFTAEPPFLADIVFHAQQAAEKGFRALLTWHSTPFRKTHSLEELGEQCLRVDPSLSAIVDRAVPLTKYAWHYRYPGEHDELTREEAERAIVIAREVHDDDGC